MGWVCLCAVHVVGSYTVWDGFVLVLFTWWGATECGTGLSLYCSHSGELRSVGWVCLGTVHIVGSYTVWDGFVLVLFT